MGYRQIRAISGRGLGEDQFREALRGIAVDAEDRVYAVGDREVKVFDDEGKLQRRWPTAKPGYCVALAPRRRVFVGEEGRIEVFDPEGKRLDMWQDADRLGRVTAIGFFENDILVADAAARCIRRFDNTPRFLNDIGADNKTKGFLIPNGHLDFGVDAVGIIHACNPGKHRVERYTRKGELLGHFGKFGMNRPEDFPGCCNPTNLTVVGDYGVVVTEKAAARAKVYDAKGKLLSVIGPEMFDQMSKNMDVAVDRAGRIYVVDPVRLRICVFGSKQSESRPASGPSEAGAGGGRGS